MSLYTYGDDTQVCVMSGISYAPGDEKASDRSRQLCIDAAADRLMELFPDNVLAIKSDVINTWEVQINTDNVHPVAAGYDALTRYIAALLNTPEYYQ